MWSIRPSGGSPPSERPMSSLTLSYVSSGVSGHSRIISTATGLSFVGVRRLRAHHLPEQTRMQLEALLLRRLVGDLQEVRAGHDREQACDEARRARCHRKAEQAR